MMLAGQIHFEMLRGARIYTAMTNSGTDSSEQVQRHSEEMPFWGISILAVYLGGDPLNLGAFQIIIPIREIIRRKIVYIRPIFYVEVRRLPHHGHMLKMLDSALRDARFVQFFDESVVVPELDILQTINVAPEFCDGI